MGIGIYQFMENYANILYAYAEQVCRKGKLRSGCLD